MLLFIQDHCTLSDTVRIALRLKDIDHEVLPIQQLTERLPKVLPGLKNFYMAGQWVEPGGGVPAVFISGRNLAKWLSKKYKRQ